MKLYCFSRKDARNFYVYEKAWSTVSLPDNVAIISIIGTPLCQKKVLHDREYHWFREKDNVLNLCFDDITRDEWHGYKGLSEEDARRAVFFIYNNIGKDFYINCRAGKSRSQAFVKFILDTFPELTYETRRENPLITPNMDVLIKLKHVVREEFLDVWWDLKKVGLDIKRINKTEYELPDKTKIAYIPYSIDENTGIYYPELFMPIDSSGKNFESVEELKAYLCRVKPL